MDKILNRITHFYNNSGIRRTGLIKSNNALDLSGRNSNPTINDEK